MGKVKIVKDKNGWSVFVGDDLIEDGLTNAAAWRLADKHNLEPINKREELSDWVHRKGNQNES